MPHETLAARDLSRDAVHQVESAGQTGRVRQAGRARLGRLVLPARRPVPPRPARSLRYRSPRLGQATEALRANPSSTTSTPTAIRRPAATPRSGRRCSAAAARGTTERRAARGGAVALPQLRALGHHLARAARRPRRPEAGAAPHPLHDVAAEPDRRRQAPQVREGRRRRDGQLPPARRRGALRDARAHGAVVLAALSARRRLGQLRLARRRQRRGHALHRVPARAHQRRDAHRDRAGDGATSGRTTTARRPSRSCCRRGIPNLLVNGATGIAVGMATNIPPHNLGEVCTALVKLLDNEELEQRAAVPLRQGPGLPDRRPDPQLAGGAEGDLQDRLGHRSGCAAPGTSARRRARPRRSTSTAFRTR